MTTVKVRSAEDPLRRAALSDYWNVGSNDLRNDSLTGLNRRSEPKSTKVMDKFRAPSLNVDPTSTGTSQQAIVARTIPANSESDFGNG